MPVRIPHELVTPRPSLVALMVEALHLQGHERVLEVGTGLGYQAAILAHLCAEVVTIERFDDLAREARRDLELAGIEHVHVIHGDGLMGHPPRAPYDAIIVTAASPVVSEQLVVQLKDGGTLVQPLGDGGDVDVIAFEKRDGRLANPTVVTRAPFMPLVPGLAEPYLHA